MRRRRERVSGGRVPGGGPRALAPRGGPRVCRRRVRGCPAPRVASSRAGRVAVVGGDSGRAPGPTRGSPQLRFSPRARAARPLAASGGCLGWRLAADLELVRTRGIRLFN